MSTATIPVLASQAQTVYRLLSGAVYFAGDDQLIQARPEDIPALYSLGCTPVAVPYADVPPAVEPQLAAAPDPVTEPIAPEPEEPEPVLFDE